MRRDQKEHCNKLAELYKWEGVTATLFKRIKKLRNAIAEWNYEDNTLAIDKKELRRIAKYIADVKVSLHQVIHAGMWCDNNFAFWVRDWMDSRIDKQIEEAFMSIMAGDCSAEKAWRMGAGK